MRQKVNKPQDMVTVSGRIYPGEGAAERLISFMRIFQAAKRTAYQALRRGEEPGDIVKALYQHFFPNARWCQWAVEDARAVMESQREQVKMHVSDLEAKIQKSEEKLERAKDSLRRQGIRARLMKLRSKLSYWQGFLDRGEVPPAVFGGKKNLILLGQGKLAKEKWREMRSSAFFSVGQANQKGLGGQYGNANTEIMCDTVTGAFHLNVYLPPEAEGEGAERRKKRPSRKKEDWVSMPLQVPSRYRSLLSRHLAKGEAYSVRVMRRDGRFDCLISFPLGDNTEVDRTLAMAGIDANPDVVAVTVVLPDGNYRVSRCFPCPDLVHASSEKRQWIAGNLAKEVATWLKGLGVTQAALEELSFAQDHDTNRWFNRITHNFCSKLLFTRLVVALRKQGISVFTVGAAFTSLIGYFKYGADYGLSAHQAAALVIARRALGFREKVPRGLARMLAPEEGCRHQKMWGKLFGLLQAARRRARQEDRLFRRWSSYDWVNYMFAGSG